MEYYVSDILKESGYMNVFATFVTWIQSHWADIGMIYLQLIGAASIIVKMTPTLKDDDALKGIIKFLGKYVALNKSNGTKPDA